MYIGGNCWAVQVRECAKCGMQLESAECPWCKGSAVKSFKRVFFEALAMDGLGNSDSSLFSVDPTVMEVRN